jgi:hypothetical protein
LPERLILGLARRFDLGRVGLYVFLQGQEQADKLRIKTTEALALIQTGSPNLYARVCRFIPRILVFGGHVYDAVYISDLRLCDVSRDYALAEATTPSRLAMTFVHEATHGYIQSGGLSYEGQRRERMERICAKTEIAFARKLPQSAELVAEVEGRLSIPSEYWESEAFVQRNIDYLREIGAPRWMVSLLKWKKAKLAQPGTPSSGGLARPRGDSIATERPPPMS